MITCRINNFCCSDIDCNITYLRLKRRANYFLVSTDNNVLYAVSHTRYIIHITHKMVTNRQVFVLSSQFQFLIFVSVMFEITVAATFYMNRQIN
jgi:hypothetical protein